jgi:dihydroorotate dehydrogenase electron transfer subunit
VRSVARPQAPFGARIVEVTARDRVGAYTVLSCRDEAGPAPAPGQFYMLMAARRWGGGDGERPYLPRAFSVLRADRAGVLQFLLDAIGPGTDRLCELAPGDGLSLVGPLGVPFPEPGRAESPLLVGGGVGIAPLAILQDHLAAGRSPRPTVLLGFRSAAYAAAAGLLHDPILTTDDGSSGRQGLVTELLHEQLAGLDAPHVYACGPPPMLEAVRRLCAERGVAAHLALESGMACGYGACFGCVVPTRNGYVRLCVDGPVLDAADLETALVSATSTHAAG